ncbi:hypothetical protein C6361_02980 [Plantactinospora sp. BC1]|nr:hypothetical protein C6361_02980 [Plantactinospora sp. BC1]AVT38131.1 hypothetical protein C6W10_18650 [Plantactinospora sp. BB1]
MSRRPAGGSPGPRTYRTGGPGREPRPLAGSLGAPRGHRAGAPLTADPDPRVRPAWRGPGREEESDVSQPEENREKSAKTDAVLRPPTAGGPARPQPPQGNRNRTEEEADRSAPPSTEEA